MGFAVKQGRPDSKDTAALRKEYQAKVAAFQDSREPASKAKAKDEKIKAFARVREQIVAERRENLSAVHKVLIQQGRLKSKEQMAAERAKIEAAREAARNQ